MSSVAFRRPAPVGSPVQVAPMGAHKGQMGAVLNLNIGMSIPFREFLKGRRPDGQPAIPDDMLQVMLDEIREEILRRGGNV
jgi:hypothetical protein